MTLRDYFLFSGEKRPGALCILKMSETEQAILDTLRELEDKVRQMATANPKPNLLPVFERIEVLTRQLPRTAHPDLLHYLHKKSYEKARCFLEGIEPQRGNCVRD